MNKLTLSVDQSVIDEAKEYAKSSGRSLSSIVEEYLKSLPKPRKTRKKKLANVFVLELKGSVKMQEEFGSYKELLQDALVEKYLKK